MAASRAERAQVFDDAKIIVIEKAVGITLLR